MKRIILAVVLALASFSATAGWISAVVTNPASSGVVVDTGQLAMSSRSAMVICSSTVAVRLRYQWRDAANTGTVREQYFFVPANGTFVIPPPLPAMEFAMAVDERLRIIVDVGVTGSISCSLFHAD